MTTQKLLENFSTHLKNVIARAISWARDTEATSVEPFHLFIGLTEEPGTVAGEILQKNNFPLVEFRKNLSKRKPANSDAPLNLPDLGPGASQVIEKSLFAAYERGHSYIGTEHLLLALLECKDPAMLALFKNLQISIKPLIDHVIGSLETSGKNTTIESMIQTLDSLAHEAENDAPDHTHDTHHATPDPKKKSKESALHFFTTNLTDSKAAKKLDPVVGRDKEIDRVINILSRRTKNNPVLIGEPGVGKTAIVEGLAKRIRSGDIPDILRRKKILSLDLTLMIAGTIYRGEFESRLKQVIDELTHSPDTILFIDELHTIIGAGSNQGTLDAANILKPALARGQLHCIGATTYDEYKKYIASDAALERRFQPVMVAEPTKAQTLEILGGIKKYYEEFHNVLITPEALEKAVDLSTKYIHDAYQPDKAIDLLDEASANVKVRNHKNPNAKKIATLEATLRELEEKKDVAMSKKNTRAATTYTKKITKLEKELQKISEKDAKKSKPSRVDAEAVTISLAARLGIDPSILATDEWETLDKLAKVLPEKIIGQTQVINEVIRTLKERYLGLGHSGKPLASFLFVGPSGVGKTEMAKILAEELYHDPHALIKLDMSEFGEGNSVAKLLGSPAGYIGYKDRNKLFDELRRRPYSVVVFDEIDKAHPDVRKLLLQILDEGELTEGGGKKVHFNHAIIILTANIGASLFKSSGIGFSEHSTHNTAKAEHLPIEVDKKVRQAVKEELGAAILSRLDSTCVFSPLNREHIETIIRKEIERISGALAIAQSLSITADKHIISILAEETFSPDLGARPVQKRIERLLPELVVEMLRKTIASRRKSRYALTREQEQYVLR